MGRALGNAFIATGHEVKMGSREAANEKAAAWVKQAGPRASARVFSRAVVFRGRRLLGGPGSNPRPPSDGGGGL